MNERVLRVAMKTMGCRVNAYDSSKIAGGVYGLPIEIVDFKQEADVYLINSCTVTAGADSDVRQLINRARRNCASARVVVTGCMATRAAEELQKLHGVDVVFSNAEKLQIPQYLAGVAKEFLSLDFLPEADSMALPDTKNRSRPLVKVQEGCEQNCAFCIIPTTRGKERSRPIKEVLREIEGLLLMGHKEIVLTGVHLGSYGRDLQTQGSEHSLALLVKEIETIGLPRLRLSSLEPWGLTDELLEVLANSSCFCKHLHLPMQSGDRNVLQAMNRPYTPEMYGTTVEKAASFFPKICIGTDVIVGFPGEDEAAFLQTYERLETLPIVYFHVFPYSPRPGTPASQFAKQVPPQETKRRSKILRELGTKKKNAFVQSFIGEEIEVLVEGRRQKSSQLMRGVSREYLTVLFDGPDSLARKSAFVRVLSAKGSVSHGILEDDGLGLSLGTLQSAV